MAVGEGISVDTLGLRERGQSGGGTILGACSNETGRDVVGSTGREAVRRGKREYRYSRVMQIEEVDVPVD